MILFWELVEKNRLISSKELKNKKDSQNIIVNVYKRKKMNGLYKFLFVDSRTGKKYYK